MATTTAQLGTLVVVVLKARNLRDKHTISKQDPYAAISIGRLRKTTGVDKRGGQHPIWDEEVHLPVLATPSKDNRTLKVSCFAKESRADDLIGEGIVDISDTLRTGEFDDWVKLEENGAYRGEVYLEMTFFAQGPAPASEQLAPSNTATNLTRRPSKLLPSERLWRPSPTPSPSSSKSPSPARSPGGVPASLLPASGARNISPSRPPQQPSTSPPPDRTHLAPPPSSRTPSPSRRESPLPQVPGDYRSSSSSPNGRVGGGDPKLQPVPSVLRPRNVKSSPTPIPSQAQQSPGQGEAYYGSGSAAVYGGGDLEDVRMPMAMPMPDPYLSNPSTTGRYERPYPLPPSSSTSTVEPSLPDPYSSTSSNTSESRSSLNRASQEAADEELARTIARNEGIDVERLRAVEADAEMARRLSRELNDEDGRVGMPGAW